MGADSASYLAVAADGPLARVLGRRPVPLTRERLAADPEFAGLSETALASLDAMGATLVVPVVFTYLDDLEHGLQRLGRRLRRQPVPAAKDAA